MKPTRQSEWCRLNPERRREIRKRSYLKCNEKDKASAARAANATSSRLACRKWYASNKDRAKALNRKTSLRLRYGLTQAEYDGMLHKQNGVCAICGGNRSVRKCLLAVDHCHITKRIRGLLCVNCNAGLGFFADSAEFLLSAIGYLATTAEKAA